ncbi:MAG TPA: hypothetical protein VMV27_10450 [Candidatus Binataceae bacterium]|nr:hypothetical protein [Candidatus Binataceae bacterium]
MPKQINPAILVILAVLGNLAILACAVSAGAGGSNLKQPADLANLEREVSLKIAHVRDEGPTDPARRKQLADAEALDTRAEREIGAGDFGSAQNDLVKANALATELLN